MGGAMNIAFNKPWITDAEVTRVAEALRAGAGAGGGGETRAAQRSLAGITGRGHVLLTHSGTGALDLACLLLDLKAGDEIILPSFTFASCANAIALRGATPVFVDCRADTLNIDETLIEAAITPRTRAVMVVHYAGIACAMEDIEVIAARHKLAVVEDAAHAIGATYRGRPLGSFGALSAFSFHATKNVVSGEGGALLLDDAALAARAEILWEKGTDRGRFLRGEVDKYTWEDVGSSFLPSEATAALLAAQLERLDEITQRRRRIWDLYHAAFEAAESRGLVRRPIAPDGCVHNGHLYYLLAPDAARRDKLIARMRARGISTPFHYVPLHSAPAGRRLGRVVGDMRVTDDVSARLLRLPLFPTLSAAEQDAVIAVMIDELELM